jgi:hypothetical protein
LSNRKRHEPGRMLLLSTTREKWWMLTASGPHETARLVLGASDAVARRDQRGPAAAAVASLGPCYVRLLGFA